MRAFVLVLAVLAGIAAPVASAHAGPCYFYPPNVYWCY
jgi:hypothetical protein